MITYKKKIMQLNVVAEPATIPSIKVEKSDDVAQYMKENFLTVSDISYKEFFYIILLNRANNIIAVEKISEGGVSATVVDLKIIFHKALHALASGVIIVHNHPSGNIKPSTADVQLTKKIIEAGKILDINILDHIILTTDSYYSFADEGFNDVKTFINNKK